MFLKRSYHKELMDDFSISDSRIEKAYNELRLINKFLGGNNTSKEGINYFVTSESALNILDAGGGASENFSHVKDFEIRFNITTLDLSLFSCRLLKKKRSNLKIICADALSIPAAENSFDLTHASLFLHHFDEIEIIRLIKNFIFVSKKGVIINDLRRNIFAYLGILIITKIFSKSEFVKNDGPLSVKRAFVKNELVEILKQAGIKNYILKRKWAFRFLLIIPVAQDG